MILINIKKHKKFQSPMSWFQRYRFYLSEFVYRGTDGTVTTFAVVAGAVGGGLKSSIMIG